MRRIRALSSVLASLALLGVAATPAVADHGRGGGDDGGGGRGGDRPRVRATGVCGGSARVTLDLKADDGAIEVELEVEHGPARATWRVVVAHEGRVAWRGTSRTGGSSGSFRVERRVPDLSGADRVSVSASGPAGLTCRVAATLPGA